MHEKVGDAHRTWLTVPRSQISRQRNLVVQERRSRPGLQKDSSPRNHYPAALLLPCLAVCPLTSIRRDACALTPCSSASTPFREKRKVCTRAMTASKLASALPCLRILMLVSTAWLLQLHGIAEAIEMDQDAKVNARRLRQGEETDVFNI